MNEHIVKSFGEELSQLAADAARMGGLAEQQIADAVDSVARRDMTARTIGADRGGHVMAMSLATP